MFGEFETKLTEHGNWTLMHVRIFQGLYITKTENHYKRMVYEKVLKDNLTLNITEHIMNDKKDNQLTYYILIITSGDDKVYIRSNNRLPLEYICYHVIIY